MTIIWKWIITIFFRQISCLKRRRMSFPDWTDFMIPFIRTSTVPVMTKHGDSSLRYLLPTILRWTVRLPVGMRNGSVMPGNPIRVPWRLHGGWVIVQWTVQTVSWLAWRRRMPLYLRTAIPRPFMKRKHVPSAVITTFTWRNFSEGYRCCLPVKPILLR